MAQDQGAVYVAEAKKVLARVEEVKKDARPWVVVVANKKGAQMHNRAYPKVCHVPLYLTQKTLKQSKAKVVGHIWNMTQDKAKLNDPKLLDWKEVAKGPNFKVCSQHNATGWPYWSRHFVFAQVKFEEGDTTKLVAFSVEHKDAPADTTQYVTGHIHMSVYEITDNKNGTTTIRRYTQVDPCGDIPTWLITWYAGNQVDMFNRWEDW
jgi:hypothetical protein